MSEECICELYYKDGKKTVIDKYGYEWRNDQLRSINYKCPIHGLKESPSRVDANTQGEYKWISLREIVEDE